MAVPYLRKPHPPCTACGGPVMQRDDEVWKRFLQRRCCSDECARELRIAGMRNKPGKRAHAGAEVSIGRDSVPEKYNAVPFVPRKPKLTRKQADKLDADQRQRDHEALLVHSRIARRPVSHPVSLYANPCLLWLLA